MYNENQLVEVKWSAKTRKHYESKGYRFTNYGDAFLVKAKDLLNSSKYHIEVICDFCGKAYYPTILNFNKRANKNVDSCNDCRIHKQWSNTHNERAKESFDKLRKICSEKNYQLITDESEYAGMNMNIEYVCSKHGIQTQILNNMLRGHECICCSYEKRAAKTTHSKEYVESVINGVNNNILMNPDDYTGVTDKNLLVKCGECGEVYTTSLDNYVHQNQTRCPHCSKRESIGEFRIRKYLEKCNISFKQWKSFDDCRDKKCLPFDFYLPDYNLIIEFDGQIHYWEVGYGNHDITVAHDKIKNEYCKSHNIDIIRIPYWDGNDIEKIIATKLNV